MTIVEKTYDAHGLAYRPMGGGSRRPTVYEAGQTITVEELDRMYERTSNPVSASLTNGVADYDPIIERLSQYAHRLDAVLVTITGSSSAAAPKETSQPGSNATSQGGCLFAGIHSRRLHLGAIADHIEQITKGLEQAV